MLLKELSPVSLLCFELCLLELKFALAGAAAELQSAFWAQKEDLKHTGHGELHWVQRGVLPLTQLDNPCILWKPSEILFIFSSCSTVKVVHAKE